MKTHLHLNISSQPTESTCGPTCLQAIYDYYDDAVGLDELIAEVPALEAGGTLGVRLATHALKRGYEAAVYSYNLQVFDPTWFDSPPEVLIRRLRAQLEHKTDPKLRVAIHAYLDFLELGGDLRFRDLSAALIRQFLKGSRPVLTGLSATWLYRSIREFGPEGDEDDLRGEPVGHFVVLCGYDQHSRHVMVADPLNPNPVSPEPIYEVDISRLVNAIILGILTYDANLIVIEPRNTSQEV